MADLNVTPDQIAKAREAGYSDDEIVSHLASKAPEKFKAAKDAGYSSGEILAHFGAAKTAPQPTTAPAEAAPEDTSIMQDIKSGVRHGISEMVRGTQSSRKNILGTDVNDAPVDPDYKPANVSNGSWNPLKWSPSQIPKLIAEQAPLAATSAAGAAVGDLLGPAGSIIGGLAPLAITSAGDTVKARAVARTGDKNAVPNDEDKAVGIGTTLASAVPGSIMHAPGLGQAVGAGLNGVGRVAANLLTRGAVGSAGNVASNTITQFGTKGSVDPSEFPEAAAGGLANVTPHLLPAVAAGSRALRMGKYNADPEAAANVATRMQNTGLDLNDIHESQQARDKVKGDIHNELKDALSNVAKQTTLTPEADNVFTAIRRGDQITPKDMETLKSATANTPDGANAHYLARALKTTQTLEGEGSDTATGGWQGTATGGMKNVVRGVFNPWHIGGTMAGLGALAVGMPHVSGAVGAGMFGGLAAGLGGARLLDTITGGSRPGANFAKTFADRNAQLRMATNPPPVQPPPLPQMQPSPGPWGPKPLAQQSVPQVQAPSLPQPLPQGTMPWKAPTTTELPQFNPMQLAELKKQMAATTAQANTPAPAPEEQPKVTITKSKGGEVHATDPYAEAGSFQPVSNDRKVYHGLTPEQIGDKVARERPEMPEMNRMGLRNAVTQTHAARDAVNADLIQQMPQHAELLHELGSQLKEPGNSDIQYSRRAIKHYTDQMDPVSSHVVRERYKAERENLWPTTAEKRAAARIKKAKAKKED